MYHFYLLPEVTKQSLLSVKGPHGSNVLYLPFPSGVPVSCRIEGITLPSGPIKFEFCAALLGAACDVADKRWRVAANTLSLSFYAHVQPPLPLFDD